MTKVNISVTLFFNEYLTEEEVQDVMTECDYNFNHQWIDETRINGKTEEL